MMIPSTAVHFPKNIFVLKSPRFWPLHRSTTAAATLFHATWPPTGRVCIFETNCTIGFHYEHEKEASHWSLGTLWTHGRNGIQFQELYFSFNELHANQNSLPDTFLNVDTWKYFNHTWHLPFLIKWANAFFICRYFKDIQALCQMMIICNHPRYHNV